MTRTLGVLHSHPPLTDDCVHVVFRVCAACMTRHEALADLFDSLTLRDEVDVQAGTAQAASESAEQTRSEHKVALSSEAQLPSQPSHRQLVPRQSQVAMSGVRSALFPHQLSGVQWMARRESGVSADGTSPLGGIVADEPGLGKTLMLLALVAQSKKQHEQQQERQHTAAVSDLPHSGPAALIGSLSSRCTLVVCPRAVLRQWQRECSVHLEAGVLSVGCVASGSSGTVVTAEEVARCDVVVTSYETVRSQHQQLITLQRQAAARTYQPAATSSSLSSTAPLDVSIVAPLFSVSYLRLIADEAHRLRNRAAQLTAAVCSLSATHRWYVTATPLQNTMDDLYSAFLFLQYAPYSEYRVWKQYMHTKDGKGRGAVQNTAESDCNQTKEGAACAAAIASSGRQQQQQQQQQRRAE